MRSTTDEGGIRWHAPCRCACPTSHRSCRLIYDYPLSAASSDGDGRARLGSLARCPGVVVRGGASRMPSRPHCDITFRRPQMRRHCEFRDNVLPSLLSSLDLWGPRHIAQDVVELLTVQWLWLVIRGRRSRTRCVPLTTARCARVRRARTGGRRRPECLERVCGFIRGWFGCRERFER